MDFSASDRIKGMKPFAKNDSYEQVEGAKSISTVSTPKLKYENVHKDNYQTPILI